MPGSEAKNVHPSELVTPSDLISIEDVFPVTANLKFTSGEYVSTETCTLQQNEKSQFIDERSFPSGVEGVNIVARQSSDGTTNVGFEIDEKAGIAAVRLLCQTQNDEKDTVAGWSSDLLSGKRGLKQFMTTKTIPFEDALAHKDGEVKHPLVILRVKKKDMHMTDIRVETHWTGTADKWNVNALVSTGGLLNQVSP